MAEPAAKAAAEADPSEPAVLAYLRAHPDLLARHPELLETLELRHASGPAVSLIERQVDILRGKNERLEERLARLTETARDNEARAGHVQRLARTLLRAPTLAAVIAGLTKVIREDFGIDHVFVGVHAPVLMRQDIGGLTRIEATGAIARTFDNFIRTRLIECGPIDEVRAKLLFADATEPVRSAAIVPLEKDKGLGMLALGSKDPERFQPRQGKMFLEMTAELMSAALRARLG